MIMGHPHPAPPRSTLKFSGNYVFPGHAIVIIAFVMVVITGTASFQIALFISLCSEVNTMR